MLFLPLLLRYLWRKWKCCWKLQPELHLCDSTPKVKECWIQMERNSICTDAHIWIYLACSFKTSGCMAVRGYFPRLGKVNQLSGCPTSTGQICRLMWTPHQQRGPGGRHFLAAGAQGGCRLEVWVYTSNFVVLSWRFYVSFRFFFVPGLLDFPALSISLVTCSLSCWCSLKEMCAYAWTHWTHWTLDNSVQCVWIYKYG